MVCWKTKARDEFDYWSKSYDRSPLQLLFFGPSHRLIFNSVSIPPGARVLDVGCGTGQFAARLLDTYPEASVVGLDLSEGMLQKAEGLKERYGDRLTLVHGDSENLPFDNNEFDLITCIHSFHHYPHQDRVLDEMYRVLSPSGELAIVDANRDNPWGWLIFDCIVATIEGAVHHCSAEEFRKLGQQSGFADIKQRYGGHVAPFMLTHAQAKKADVALREAA
ncbi:Demethylrebeccamycin-D-glucose O-methyltransferase [Planctomycetes bacterium Pan216]|uniref:Demethylrebeccamycin-D-glucose O-methyltransferase n=1 Tax=Kolteria novifilia TaxID=2527975 RepID=A0A518AZI0_9BACT|nr:Demethylrebeccamycin-D-glucose O-methyltransferase [Planctomycetes bacterium Pan216]